MSKVATSFSRLLERFIHTESSSSLVLALSTFAAMIAANSPVSSAYFHVLEFKTLGLSVHHWINDGLMAVFFFVIGMEIKREVVAGELSTLRKAALPVFAAIGGMVVPAIIYLGINPEGAAARGWAIPMATDIAFALGVLTLLGNRVPLSLKVFLLALAIVDDLGAVLVIATVYTSEIKSTGLFSAAAIVSLIFWARRLSLRSYFIYLPLGALLWISILYSGVHATIAGVVLGLLTPSSFSAERGSLLSFSPLDELVEKLHPWVSFFIMPIFALANAGISFNGFSLSTFFDSSTSSGVFWGLFLGKPLGIMLATFLACLLRLAAFPSDLEWKHLFGASALAGIGFTMAIFIANLSLVPDQAIRAKTAILLASAVSALLGFLILIFRTERSVLGR